MKEEYVVNLLGKGQGWEKINDITDGEVWGVNDAFLRTKCDKCFHMHNLDVFGKTEKTASSTRIIVERMKKEKDMEFFTIEEYKPIPNAKIYPLDDIINYFKSNYFSSTIDYMLAYAIYKGATKIRLIGVNMSVMNEEYYSQKPSAEYWIGLAEGRGIEVELNYTNSSLMKTKDGLLYGYLTNQWKVDKEN